jgi:hypothetical protein
MSKRKPDSAGSSESQSKKPREEREIVIGARLEVEWLVDSVPKYFPGTVLSVANGEHCVLYDTVPVEFGWVTLSNEPTDDEEVAAYRPINRGTESLADAYLRVRSALCYHVRSSDFQTTRPCPQSGKTGARSLASRV